MEEAGHHLAPVLGGDDLRELHHARDAELALPKRLGDLRVALDQLGGGLPVEGGALREPQLPVQEIEEAGVAELDPPSLPVEVGEGDEEVGQGAVFAAEELGEALREISLEPVKSEFTPSWVVGPGFAARPRSVRRLPLTLSRSAPFRKPILRKPPRRDR